MWFNVIKGGGQKIFKKWLRAFIREHLESMEVGEMITTREMFDLVEAGKGEATFLAPPSGIGGIRPEIQIRFGSGRNTPKISMYLIGMIIKENKDIIQRKVASPKSTRTLGWERI
jgi:hypothetical protein